MSQDPDIQPLSDKPQDNTRHGLFTLDQMLEMQRLVTETTQQQARRVLVVTNNFIITIVAVLSSAFGLIVALAWNRAITDWLPTSPFLTIKDNLLKEFAYAGLVTILGIIMFGVLGLLTQRIKGENLLHIDHR